MKRHKKTIIFLAVGMISLAVNAGTNNDLLFYCNFDGSANATSSRGDGAASDGPVWHRTPPEALGLRLTGNSLRFLIWAASRDA